MVEMIKDNRTVIKGKNGKFYLTLDQEQVYDAETVKNMIEGWKTQKEQYKIFLNNYDKTLEQGIIELKAQMEKQKQKVEIELNFIDEGLCRKSVV